MTTDSIKKEDLQIITLIIGEKMTAYSAEIDKLHHKVKFWLLITMYPYVIWRTLYVFDSYSASPSMDSVIPQSFVIAFFDKAMPLMAILCLFAFWSYYLMAYKLDTGLLVDGEKIYINKGRKKYQFSLADIKLLELIKKKNTSISDNESMWKIKIKDTDGHIRSIELDGVLIDQKDLFDSLAAKISTEKLIYTNLKK